MGTVHRLVRLHAVGDLRVEESDGPPAPTAGWSTVAVTSVGLCGSDLHWYAEGGTGEVSIDSPVVPGHEFAGVALDGPYAGRRVAVDPAIPCGRCESCRAGHANLCPDVRFAGHQDPRRRTPGTSALARRAPRSPAGQPQRRRRRAAGAAGCRDPRRQARARPGGARRARRRRRPDRRARGCGRAPCGCRAGLRVRAARASSPDRPALRCGRGLGAGRWSRKSSCG